MLEGVVLDRLGGGRERCARADVILRGMLAAIGIADWRGAADGARVGRSRGTRREGSGSIDQPTASLTPYRKRLLHTPSSSAVFFTPRRRKHRAP